MTCPRCKSSKWNEKKSRRWEKNGNLYAVLFDNEIKVGQSINARIRINNYSKKKDFYVSRFSERLKNKEKLLIKKASDICGNVLKGREYFKGGKIEYEKIVSFIKEIEGDLLTDLTIKKEERNSNLYDAGEVGCLVCLDSFKTIEKAILQERTNMKEAIKEAISDSNDGICTNRDALLSLFSMITRLEDSAREEINMSLESKIKKYGYMINDISSL